MEAHPDFDAKEVARTVALAVSTLHHRGLSSDSGNDETPLISKKMEEPNVQAFRSSAEDDDFPELIPQKRSWFSGLFERIPARIVLTILGFLGFCNVYALRVNLSVAMVAMVNSSAYASNGTKSEECSELSLNHTTKKDGEFIWSPSEQSTILASFFFGYIVTQIPGGRMAEVVGGKWLFGLGVFCTSVLTLLTPVVAVIPHYGYGALIALRIFEGLGEGVTFPAMHAMLGHWLPKNERSMLSTIIYSGAQIGTVISMPISGILCDSDFLGGWPSVFYVFGFLGCVWFVFWCLLIYETPSSHPRISKIELLLIETNNDSDETSKQKLAIPWKSILTSVPVWALILTHFGQNWGFYTLLTEMPTYLSAILHFPIKDNGFLSALPYLLQAVVSWVTSYIADFLRRKEYLKISTIRKLFNSIGFFGPAVCLMGVALVGCHYVASVVFLTFALGFNGCIYSGFMVTHVDMSPDYAGTLMGMTNGFATLTGFLAPEVVGALTENHQTLARWQIIFYLSTAVYVVSGLIFIICGSAKLQPWGVSVEEKEKRSDEDDSQN